MLLNIKQLRKNKNLSQQQIADKIGISVRMFAEYENGNADIPLSKLQNIADALEVDLIEVIAKTQKMHVFNEPAEEYLSFNATEKLINTLEREIQDLRSDKEFLKKVIDSITPGNRQTGS